MHNNDHNDNGDHTTGIQHIGVRLVITLVGLLFLWQCIVWIFQTPHYILPSPVQVAIAWQRDFLLIASHTLITLVEILLGLLFGTLAGLASALVMARYSAARRWLLPVLVISQALPVFALAPILVLWLGYGIPSKVAMAVLIIYFPVTSACYDGLRQTNTQWIDLAHTMGASNGTILRQIRLKAAMPALGSGLRIAAAIAPIGAVVGEWVGSSGGLGYLMLHANARVQIDAMFAALFTLALLALVIYFSVDKLLNHFVYWVPHSH